MRPAVAGGGAQENPGLNLVISAGQDSIRRPLFAFDAARSMLDLAIPFEFRWVQSLAERDALFASLAGPHELTVEVQDPPLSRTYAVQAGQTIQVEGAPYELTIESFDPSWELISPGFEGARSPAANVAVKRGELKFTRMVLQRFPQRSQDVDDKGLRKRDGLIDANISLKHRTSANGYVLIVAGPDIDPAIGVFDPAGAVRSSPIVIGQPQKVQIGALPIEVQVTELHRFGRERLEPVVEPLEVRRPNIGPRAMSAIRLRFAGRGENAGWSDTQWVTFSVYEHVDARRIHVHPPSGEDYELTYSRLRRELGVALAPGKLTVDFFPGRQSVESWRSDFSVIPPSGWPYASSVQTNYTAKAGEWTLFQSGAANDHWSFTVLGVGNRHGIWPMLLGCVMIPLGCLYAFYVKPVLTKRRKQRGLAPAHSRARAGAVRTNIDAPELAEVR
jgi:hypothetical protein